MGILAGLAVGTLVAAGEYETFKVSKTVLFWVTVSFAAASAAANGLSVWGNFRGWARTRAEVRVQLALTQCLVAVAKEIGVDPDHLGVSAYIPAVRWVKSDASVFLGLPAEVLVRVVRFRLQDVPQPSRVARTRSKGAVGECWATSRTIHRPWRQQAVQHSGASMTRQQFDQLSAHLRDGFEYAEYLRIAHKYSEVLAVPVLSEAGDLVGVLSLDLAMGANVQRDVLSTSAVDGIASVTATIVRDDLKHLFPIE
ncbi:hypothetical protein [Nocardioides sp. GY 10127]|uniref:hypothetical protein n=1 Tax=Nocardioides sp. GY 10127 TaxID=2569762 RepID=UPI0010A882DC|nr:hypothetical protein [Nocardioides sp. GY 10127]TIC78819.1 hypothetical protein E8D37_19170 [Nocardioides sp. GY 10127]